MDRRNQPRAQVHWHYVLANYTTEAIVNEADLQQKMAVTLHSLSWSENFIPDESFDGIAEDLRQFADTLGEEALPVLRAAARFNDTHAVHRFVHGLLKKTAAPRIARLSSSAADLELLYRLAIAVNSRVSCPRRELRDSLRVFVERCPEVTAQWLIPQLPSAQELLAEIVGWLPQALPSDLLKETMAEQGSSGGLRPLAACLQRQGDGRWSAAYSSCHDSREFFLQEALALGDPTFDEACWRVLGRLDTEGCGSLARAFLKNGRRTDEVLALLASALRSTRTIGGSSRGPEIRDGCYLLNTWTTPLASLAVDVLREHPQPRVAAMLLDALQAGLSGSAAREAACLLAQQYVAEPGIAEYLLTLLRPEAPDALCRDLVATHLVEAVADGTYCPTPETLLAICGALDMTFRSERLCRNVYAALRQVQPPRPSLGVAAELAQMLTPFGAGDVLRVGLLDDYAADLGPALGALPGPQRTVLVEALVQGTAAVAARLAAIAAECPLGPAALVVIIRNLAGEALWTSAQAVAAAMLRDPEFTPAHLSEAFADIHGKYGLSVLTALKPLERGAPAGDRKRNRQFRQALCRQYGVSWWTAWRSGVS